MPFAFTACGGGGLSVGVGLGMGSAPAGGDLSLEVGTPVDVRLPAGSGGWPPYTYALSCSPALEGTGLLFTPDTRRLQGRPLAAWSGVCDYSVTDDLETEIHRSFAIHVAGLDRLTFLPSELFVHEEGRGSYVVRLSEPAPDGGVRIAIRPQPGADPDLLVDGDLQARGRQSTVFIPAGLVEGTVHVDALGDDDGEQGHVDLLHVVDAGPPGTPVARGTIRVHEVEPGFDLPAVEDRSFQVGVEHSVTLPLAARGIAPYRYALRCQPSLRAVGLDWSPRTRTLGGTPTAASRVDCVYSATDDGGAGLRLERAFVVDISDRLSLPPVEDRSFDVGRSRPETLPPATGGTPPYTYDLACQPALGGGLAWTAETRRLAGLPDAPYHGECRYSATDASNASSHRSLTVTVVDRTPALSLPPVDNRSFDVGVPVPVQDAQLPAASDGDPPYTYALSCTPALDGAGLVFTPGTRRLQGRPATAYYGVCDYSVTDAQQASVHRSFSVDVSGQDRLTIRPTELFVHEGGRGFYTVRLSAPAPGGGVQVSVRKKPGADPSFRIDADVGALGLQDTLYIRPGESEGRVYVHADADDDSVEGVMEVFNIVHSGQPGASPATGTIRVHEVEPRFDLPEVADQSLRVGVAHSVILPIAARGLPPYRYALDCEPSLGSVGLAFTAGTRELKGTPTAEHPGLACVYSATDLRDVRVERELAVTVSLLRLSLPPVGNRSFDVGVPVNGQLPAASGGDAPYTYALSCTPPLDGTTLVPPRPTGLVFTPGTRRLQGRPSTAWYGVCDYSVTDATQTSAHRSFSIDVSGRDKLTFRPAELFVHEGGRGSYIVGLSAPAPSGGTGVQISIRRKSGADPSFRIDADLGARGLQNTLYIPPGQSEGRVHVYADEDADSVEGYMDVFHVVNAEQPGASPATGTIRVHEVEPKFELPAVEDQTFQVSVARSVTLPMAARGVRGTPPYEYELTCEPPLEDLGLTFTPGTRVLAGTATAAHRDVDCVYSATDSATERATVEQAFTVTVLGTGDTGGTPSLPELGDIDLSVGIFGSSTLPAATGGVEPYTYTFTCAGGALPQDMYFVPDTRVFAGAPAAPFHESCTYTVTDSATPAATVSKAVEVEVTEVAVTPLSLPEPAKIDLSVDTFHTGPLPAASDGVPPYTYSFTCAGGAPPPGMRFVPATRVFAGTPTAPFHDSCTYAVTDSATPAAAVSKAVEVEVTGGIVAPLSLPRPPKIDLSVGIFGSSTLPAASGGVQPYTYSLTCVTGTLPPGMGFAPAARILAGTPTARFRDTCAYTVTDSATPAATASRGVEVEVASRVAPLSVAQPSVGTLTVNAESSIPPLPLASGGVGPYSYTFACAGGSLPPGMRFTRATRILGGTPSAHFRDTCTYTVTDSATPAATVSKAVEVTVTNGSVPDLSLPKPVVPDLKLNEYSVRESFGEATGGERPYTYAVVGCTLPAGLTFDPVARVLSGTPTVEYDGPDGPGCIYRVKDATGVAFTKTFALKVVKSVGTPSTLALTLGNNDRRLTAPLGTSYSKQLPAAASDSGTPPYSYTFTCAGGSLPPGIRFTPATRTLAGTPDARFKDSCAYTVTDSATPRATVSKAVTVEVTGRADPLSLPPSITPGLPPGLPLTIEIGESVRRQFHGATGGLRPYTYAVIGCALPSGLRFDPGTRTLSGTPAVKYQGSGCIYRVRDSASTPASVDRTFALTVVPRGGVPALSLPAVSLPTFTAGTFYSEELPPATGGVQPYAYALTCAGGSLPRGMNFVPATRILAGTPTAVFQDSCTYSVTDSATPAATASRALDVEVKDTPYLSLQPVDPQSYTVGQTVNKQLLVASGGRRPYTYRLDCSGALPGGLAFSSATGVLSGRPTTPYYGACDYSVSDSSTPVRRTLPLSVLISITGTSSAVLQIDTTGRKDDPLEFQVEQVTRRGLPPVRGGTPPYELSLTGCPDWIRRSGGDLFGYPPATAQAVPVACTFSVTDSATPVPGTDSYVFLVRAIHPPPDAFFFEPRHVVERNLPVGQRITPIALPRALNGKQKQGDSKVKLTYSLQPPLPDGLCLDETLDATPPSTTAACATARSYELEVGAASNYLWIRGKPTFASLLRSYCLDVKDAAGTTPPGSRCFNLATVSYDVPRFTNITGTSYSVTTLSIVLSKTTTCFIKFISDGHADNEPCPDVGTAAPSSLEAYDIKLPLPIRPGDWSNTDGAFELEPKFAASNSRFSFVPDTSPLNHPIVRWKFPGTFSTKAITGNGAEPHVAYTYGVSRTSAGKGREAAICFDLRYVGAVDANGSPVRRFVETKGATDNDPRQGYWVHDWIVTHRFRDDATRRSTGEFVCFPRPLGDDTPSSSQPPGTTSASASNPVHEALGPVHARHAAGVAHDAVRDRLRAWDAGRTGPSDADPTQPWSVTPRVGFGSLSGESDGFDYSGSSESASLALDTGQAAWQAGLVAAATRTDLTYQAEAALRSRGYATGDHETEIFSLHPFAAWHAPSGGHVWGSLGAGSGTLRHRDALGFPSWSRSDVELRTWALGAALPVAGVLSGELQAEADVEAFAFDIEGGGAISTALPILRGRDWRAGLAWSAPVTGAPALSVAYKRLTGDGPEGTRMEAAGSVAFAGLLDPRLTVSGRAEASFGLGDYEHDSWRLGGAVDFASGRDGRGVSVDLDTRLVSLDDGRSAGAGMEAEVGYGLWGGRFLGLVRPYLGLTGYPGEASIRRAVGLYLRDTPATHVAVEVWEHSDDPSTGLGLRARLRF